MNEAATHRPDRSPWWPLKWMFLALVSAFAATAIVHPEQAKGEWAPLLPLILAGPLLAIAVRDFVLLLQRQEPSWQRGFRAASAVIALSSLLTIAGVGR